MSYIKLLVPAFFACCCNALANMFWKFRFQQEPLHITGLMDLVHLFLSWRILLGICFYGCSMFLFFYMLSHFKLSAIMPVTCMTYILNIAIARLAFHETISPWQLAGTGIIILGLIVLSRSSAV